MRKTLQFSRVLLISLLASQPSLAQWVYSGGSSGHSDFNSSISIGNAFLLSIPGIQRSTDDGMTWYRASDAPAASLGYDGAVAYAVGETVQRSLDGGEHWGWAGNGLPQNLTGGKVVCSRGNAIIGSRQGIFVSTDRGTNWTKVTANLPSALDVRSILSSEGVVLACGEGLGIFRSTDGGVSWRIVNLDASLDLVLAAGPKFYARYYREPGTPLHSSRDSGSTWTLRTSSLPSALSFAEAGGRLFLGDTGYAGVYRSTNEGATWTPFNAGLQDYRVKGLAVHKDWLFAGTPGSMFRVRLTDSTWQPLPGFVASDVRVIAHNRGSLFAGSGTGLYRSTNQGSTWLLLGQGLPRNDAQFGGAYVHSLAFKDTLIFASVSGGGKNGVYRSSDKGTTWKSLAQGLTGVAASCLAASQSLVLLGTFDGEVYRSTNNGNSWIAGNTTLRHEAVNAFGFSDDFVFAATDSGLHRSNDNGAAWHPITFMSGLWSIWIRDILVFGPKIYVATWDPNGGVYFSSDDGASWSGSASGLASTDVDVLGQVQGRIFACARSGIYISDDGGFNWKSIGTGLPGGRSLLGVASDSTYVFAASEGNGVWRRPLAEIITGIETTADRLPAQFTLDQNFPNPFNPSTTIGYAVPARSHVTLTVFDILGRQVAELVNSPVEPGFHEVLFSASGSGNLASGVYVYRLQSRLLDPAAGPGSRGGAGEHILTRKALLLR